MEASIGAGAHLTIDQQATLLLEGSDSLFNIGVEDFAGLIVQQA